jgi:hypothetical protein
VNTFFEELMNPESDLPDEIDLEILERAVGIASHEPRPLPGTAYTDVDLRREFRKHPELTSHPEFAMAQLADLPAQPKTMDQLGTALQYVAGQVREELRLARELGDDNPVEHLRDEGLSRLEDLRDERERAAEEAAERASEQNTDEALAAAHAWMRERGHAHDPTTAAAVAHIAIGLATDRPELPYETILELAEQQVAEIARFAADANGLLGAAQIAVEDIPALEDVSFLEPIRTVLDEPVDPFASVSDTEVEQIARLAGMDSSEPPENEPTSITEAGGFEVDEAASKGFVNRIMQGDMTADANEVIVRTEPDVDENDAGHGREVGLSESIEW